MDSCKTAGRFKLDCHKPDGSLKWTTGWINNGTIDLLVPSEELSRRKSPPPPVPERGYARHWTPVHLDFVVSNIEVALLRAMEQRGYNPFAPLELPQWRRQACRERKELKTRYGCARDSDSLLTWSPHSQLEITKNLSAAKIRARPGRALGPVRRLCRVS